MPSVLAIVSKALFEKMVPKDVKLGTAVSIDRYVSKNKTFDQLASGGSIFLVTVRPPDEKLWLVGILENPKKEGDAWISAPNATPLADITGAIRKLKFESGKGLAAKKGALGMSLQTPRALTDADEEIVRGFVAGKAAKKNVAARRSYADAVAKGPKKKSGLRFERYRRPFKGKIGDIVGSDKEQIEQLLREEGGGDLKAAFASIGKDDEQLWEHMELMDIVDDATDAPKYQFYLWPYGSGAIFEHGTTDVVVNVCQHGLDGIEDAPKGFARELERAWKVGNKRFRIQEMVDFGDADDD